MNPVTFLGWCWLMNAVVFSIVDGESGKQVYKVGAIFHENNYDAEVAFKYAIDRANMYNKDFEISPVIHTVTSIDSFKAGKIACSLTTEGVAAIFGPESIETKGIVESVCENLEIPHIQYAWDPEPPGKPNKMSVNFYPDQSTLSLALAALVADYDWIGFTILYEDDDGLIRLQEVLKQHKAKDHSVVLRQLEAGEDNRPLLKEVRSSGEVHIILDCASERVLDYLRQANDVKLMEDYQSYILTAVDAHTIDFEELKYGRSNVTCLRMIDPTSYEIKSAVRDWEVGERMNGRHIDIQAETVRLGAAVINDAVHHFNKALMDLSSSQETETMSIPCDDSTPWKNGLGIINYMKVISTEGLTGKVKFDEDSGRRSEFIIDIVELSKTGFKKIGFWDTVAGINYTRTSGEVLDILAEKWQNKTFIVTSRIGAPYLLDKEPKDGETLTGNDRYEGYSLDLIDGISKILNFSYVFELAPDGRYGSYNKETKKWDGLVKELLDRKADLAICDLTITYDRRTAVDFTMPFMTLGISILFAKADKKDPDLFSFLSPLSVEVWIYMATAYLGISILLFILGRMAPKEWLNPHPCNKDPEELENSWNLLNCYWLTLGSLMAQGCDIMPKMAPKEWSNPHPCDSDNTELENALSITNSMWMMMGSLLQQGSDILPKMAPKEWSNPHPCDSENSELENILTLLNSLWLMMGSFLQQGSDIMPKAVSTRMVAGMWWFFTLIMISSYTANLAAFLTNERMDATISSAEDLAKQSKIKYGAVLGGSTGSFFKESNFSTYKRMAAVMESTRPSVFVKNNDEGRERVSKGKRLYAFFMESTSIEYIVERYCDLQQIGGLLDSKGYGIAMPMNSPYRTAISGAVLRMQEEGKLHQLKTKWWKKMHGGGKCKDEDSGGGDDSAAELGIENVGGVFVVLGCGCGIAFCIALVEFFWNIQQVAVEEKCTQMEALKAEFKFALNIWETTKPVHTPSTDTSSSKSSASNENREDRAVSEARSIAANVLHSASSFMRLDKIF